MHQSTLNVRESLNKWKLWLSVSCIQLFPRSWETDTVLRCLQKFRKYSKPCLSCPSLSLRLMTTVRFFTIGSIEDWNTPNSHYRVCNTIGVLQDCSCDVEYNVRHAWSRWYLRSGACVQNKTCIDCISCFIILSNALF